MLENRPLWMERIKAACFGSQYYIMFFRLKAMYQSER